MMKNILFLLSLSVFSWSNAYADAGISLGATRVIYNGNAKQASVEVNNSDKKAFLIQSWVTQTPDSTTKEDKLFIVTPPLYRLEADSSNSVRVVYIGDSLPQDRESLFWLNIKAIPSTQKTDDNKLVIAIKSQIKLFYRPAGLQGDANDAYKNIKFSARNNQLVINNPTSFYVSLNKTKIDNTELNETITLAPFSDKTINKKVSVGQSVKWDAINDFGATTSEMKASIN